MGYNRICAKVRIRLHIWIGSLDKEANLEEVIGFKEEIKKEVEAIAIPELLKANIGKRVIITFGKETIKGKIKPVPEDRKLEQEAIGSFRVRYMPSVSPSSFQYQLSPVVIIETKDGEVALTNNNSISKIEFPEGYSNRFLSREKKKRIKFKVATQKRKVKVDLAHLQKGISWIPTYLINIKDSKKARITQSYLSGEMLEMETSSLDYGYSTIKDLPRAYEEDFFLYNKKGVSLNKR